jgi:hypothetical protein
LVRIVELAVKYPSEGRRGVSGQCGGSKEGRGGPGDHVVERDTDTLQDRVTKKGFNFFIAMSAITVKAADDTSPVKRSRTVN